MKEPPWDVDFLEVMKPVGGDSLEEKVNGLLKKLMDAGHWGPFEHPAITFGFENMSRVTLAQVTRHRIATFDIQSARAVDLRDLKVESLVSPPSFSADSAKSRKSGTKSIRISRQKRQRMVRQVWQSQLDLYRKLVEGGVPAEDARYVLPLATAVHGTMTFNARSLMHVIAIRTFGDAQWEIRELASRMLSIAKDWMPFTFTYFGDKIMTKRSILAP